MVDDLPSKLAAIRGTLDAVHQQLLSELSASEAKVAELTKDLEAAKGETTALKATHESALAHLKDLLEGKPPAPLAAPAPAA